MQSRGPRSGRVASSSACGPSATGLHYIRVLVPLNRATMHPCDNTPFPARWSACPQDTILLAMSTAAPDSYRTLPYDSLQVRQRQGTAGRQSRNCFVPCLRGLRYTVPLSTPLRHASEGLTRWVNKNFCHTPMKGRPLPTACAPCHCTAGHQRRRQHGCRTARPGGAERVPVQPPVVHGWV